MKEMQIRGMHIDDHLSKKGRENQGKIRKKLGKKEKKGKIGCSTLYIDGDRYEESN